MVEAARACGASAKFAGSGGAIVGTYHDEAMFERVNARMAELNCRTIKPQLM
jgi:glucuronokinase